MKAPITIAQLSAIIAGAKRQGWEEGRAVAVDAFQADYQAMGAEDKMFVVSRATMVLAVPNPYGDPA